MSIDKDALVRVLGEHPRGDWSDGTFSCRGCADRLNEEAEERFAGLGREPTLEELRAFRDAYSRVSHPRWSLAEYHAHVAEQILALSS